MMGVVVVMVVIGAGGLGQCSSLNANKKEKQEQKQNPPARRSHRRIGARLRRAARAPRACAYLGGLGEGGVGVGEGV